jgi:hypothetical protein
MAVLLPKPEILGKISAHDIDDFRDICKNNDELIFPIASMNGRAELENGQQELIYNKVSALIIRLAVGLGPNDISFIRLNTQSVLPKESQRPTNWHTDSGCSVITVCDYLSPAFLHGFCDNIPWYRRRTMSKAQDYICKQLNAGHASPDFFGLRAFYAEPLEVIRFDGRHIHSSTINTTTKVIPRTWLAVGFN